MAPVTLLTWDYKEQPDLAELAAAVARLSGGTVNIRQWEGHGTDSYVLVIADHEVSDAEAEALWYREPVPETPAGEDTRDAPDGEGTDARLKRWVKDNVPDTAIREGGGALVAMTGGQIYDLMFQVAERMYWHGADDVRGRRG